MTDLSQEMHVFELLPAYAIGSLEADERTRVEAHLLSCWTCRDEASAFQTVIDELSLAAPVAIPSPALKARLLQRVEKAASVQPKVQDRVTFLRELSPLWELVQEGIDLNTIEWSQH